MLLDMLRALVDDVVACDGRVGREDRAVPVLGAVVVVVRVSVSCRGCRAEWADCGLGEERSWWWLRRRGCDSWSNRDNDIDIPVERLTDPRLDEAPEDEP